MCLQTLVWNRDALLDRRPSKRTSMKQQGYVGGALSAIMVAWIMNLHATKREVIPRPQYFHCWKFWRRLGNRIAFSRIHSTKGERERSLVRVGLWFLSPTPHSTLQLHSPTQNGKTLLSHNGGPL